MAAALYNCFFLPIPLHSSHTMRCAEMQTRIEWINNSTPPTVTGLQFFLLSFRISFRSCIQNVRKCSVTEAASQQINHERGAQCAVLGSGLSSIQLHKLKITCFSIYSRNASTGKRLQLQSACDRQLSWPPPSLSSARVHWGGPAGRQASNGNNNNDNNNITKNQ